MVEAKKDGRANGLNTMGYPLRKIVEHKDGKHILRCGHSLEPVGVHHPRWRRCPECGVRKSRRQL